MASNKRQPLPRQRYTTGLTNRLVWIIYQYDVKLLWTLYQYDVELLWTIYQYDVELLFTPAVPNWYSHCKRTTGNVAVVSNIETKFVNQGCTYDDKSIRPCYNLVNDASGGICTNINTLRLDLSWWRHQMETFSALLAICAGNSAGPVNSPHKGQWRELWCFLWSVLEWTIE